MAERHWSDEGLLAHLYGAAPEDAHLEGCGRCHMLLADLRSRREWLLSHEPAVPEEFLAVQRRAVRRRLEQPGVRLHLRAAPVLAALLLVLVILTVYRPAPEGPPVDSMSDAKVFEDAFEVASSTEPEAVEPVQSLFEVQQ